MIRLSAKLGFGILTPKKKTSFVPPLDQNVTRPGILGKDEMQSIVLSKTLQTQMQGALEHKNNEVEIDRDETDFLELGRMLRMRNMQNKYRSHPALQQEQADDSRLVLFSEIDMSFDE